MSFNPDEMFVFPIDREPYVFEQRYVDENVFLKQNATAGVLPKYDDIKHKLPQPIWEGHDDTINCYNRTWEIAFGNLRNANEKSRFVSDYIDCAFFTFSFMWDSSFIVMFGKYAGHIFNFQKTLDFFDYIEYNRCVHKMPVCWNWQTRRTQNPLLATACGFKSHHRHQNNRDGFCHPFNSALCTIYKTHVVQL